MGVKCSRYRPIEVGYCGGVKVDFTRVYHRGTFNVITQMGGGKDPSDPPPPRQLQHDPNEGKMAAGGRTRDVGDLEKSGNCSQLSSLRTVF